MSLLSSHNGQPPIDGQGRRLNDTDSKARPRTFSGLPTEDILTWLDHMENIAGYHDWSDARKARELRTLLDGVAATWFLQQDDSIKNNWHQLREKLIENFAHKNAMHSALQQLHTLKQQLHEPVASFAVKVHQLLTRADPNMSEDMKLYFLMPRLRHDIARRVHDQGPTTFRAAVQIAQRVESILEPATQVVPWPPSKTAESTVTPMDIDVQNAQWSSNHRLPERDQSGRPRCFNCNMYGHVRKYCRKGKSHSQPKQIHNAQVTLTDVASLSELPENC